MPACLTWCRMGDVARTSLSRATTDGADGRSDVFVYWTAVPGQGDVSKIIPRLDQDERARAERFHFREDRHAFVTAHGLLRHALDQIAGDRLAKEGTWRFRDLPGGKPVIVGARGGAPHCSLSHTRPMVAAAVSWAGPLGVDIETMTRAVRRENVAGLAFSPEEQALLGGLGEEAWTEAFFTLWTLKEAAVKATGQGLSADLQGFSFALAPPYLRTSGPDGSHSAEWQFHASRVADCRLAVALHAGIGTNAVFHISEIAFDAL